MEEISTGINICRPKRPDVRTALCTDLTTLISFCTLDYTDTTFSGKLALTMEFAFGQIPKPTKKRKPMDMKLNSQIRFSLEFTE